MWNGRGSALPIQLTLEQEQRLEAVVNSGAYPTTEAALNAALSVVEQTAWCGFEGSDEELEALLLEGLNSGESTDGEDVWQRIRAQTDVMLAEHKARLPHS